MLSPGDGTLEHSGPRKLTSISLVVKGGNELEVCSSAWDIAVRQNLCFALCSFPCSVLFFLLEITL